MNILKKSYLPFLVIVAGILFSLFLQFLVPDMAFFSGDAGLKAMLAKQLSMGNWHFDLQPPKAIWVSKLWQEGLYPYEPPFVYHVQEKYYITFPFTFPLVTAPFYALFGYGGLYIIPLIATWVIWFTFFAACQKLKVGEINTSIGLIGLIFASNLTLYSAMYWEHTLAVALAFAGLVLFILVRNNQNISNLSAIFSGCLIGLAVWFRPEFLCLVALIIGLVGIAFASKLRKIDRLESIYFLDNKKEIFLASLILTIGLFFLCNQLIYGHFLGIHAIQIVEETTLAQRLNDFQANFLGMLTNFFLYFPLAYFPLFYLLAKVIVPKIFKLNLPAIVIYLSSLALIIGVSFLVPVGTAGLIAGGKQWGPRFLLILIPVLTLFIVHQLESIETKTPKLWQNISLFLLAIFLIIGAEKNLNSGLKFLTQNNNQILPAVEFLQTKSNTNIVAISNQFVGQVLEPTEKQDQWYFEVKDLSELIKLTTTLIKEKQNNFLYICYPHRPCNLPETPPEKMQFSQDNRQFFIQLFSLGKFGKYPIYEGKIIAK